MKNLDIYLVPQPLAYHIIKTLTITKSKSPDPNFPDIHIRKQQVEARYLYQASKHYYPRLILTAINHDLTAYSLPTGAPSHEYPYHVSTAVRELPTLSYG